MIFRGNVYCSERMLKKRIAHRDLKPENLILNEFNCKYIISDFGEAIQLPEDSNEIYEFCVGTITYMSKEMFD